MQKENAHNISHDFPLYNFSALFLVDINNFKYKICLFFFKNHCSEVISKGLQNYILKFFYNKVILNT